MSISICLKCEWRIELTERYVAPSYHRELLEEIAKVQVYEVMTATKQPLLQCLPCLYTLPLSARSCHNALLLWAPRNEICIKKDTIVTGGVSIIDRPCLLCIGVSSKLYRRMTKEKKVKMNGKFEVTEDPFYDAPMLSSWSLHNGRGSWTKLWYH